MSNFIKILGIATVFSLLLVSCDEMTNSTEPTDDGNPLAMKNNNTIFDLNFSNSADADDNTTSSAGWVTDRKAPESFGTTSFDGDDRLHINMDESGPTSGFYGYQGKKYQDADGEYWYAESNSRFSYKFYINPDWEDDGGEQQESGVWPVLGNSNGNISAYPVLEYQDSDANENGEAGFRAFVYISDDDGNFAGAEWINIGLPKNLKIDPEEGGWVTVEAQLHKVNNGSALKWRINNKLVLDERNYNVSAESTQFLEFIFNSGNFGDDVDYYYDDIKLTKAGK